MSDPIPSSARPLPPATLRVIPIQAGAAELSATDARRAEREARHAADAYAMETLRRLGELVPHISEASALELVSPALRDRLSRLAGTLRGELSSIGAMLSRAEVR